MSDGPHTTPPGSLRAALRRADEAASCAHDFVYDLNGVTKQQASDAIWLIHNELRPLIAAVDPCIECGRDRHGYSGQLCRYCAGTAE
jgi:hypothetical protein